MILAAAILVVVGIALFVAAPLTETARRKGEKGAERLELERLEHEHGLALNALRELEFDRRMGKLSDSDYVQMRQRLEERTLAVMSAITRSEQERSASLELRHAEMRSSGESNDKTDGAQKTCPHCGETAGEGARFCAACGSGFETRAVISPLPLGEG